MKRIAPGQRITVEVEGLAEYQVSMRSGLHPGVRLGITLADAATRSEWPAVFPSLDPPLQVHTYVRADGLAGTFTADKE